MKVPLREVRLKRCRAGSQLDSTLKMLAERLQSRD